VPFTAVSDKSKKETFSPWMEKKSWERFAALSCQAGTSLATILKSFATMVPWRRTFCGLRPRWNRTVGSETTINSGDMAGILMIAVQALEKRTAELKQKEAQLVALQSEVNDLKAKHAYFETVAARLEALELRKNYPMQIAETSVSVQ
jgi:Tfp pilus assembly protein PilN